MNGTLIVGIDLGTTNSEIAVWDPEQRRAIPIPNAEGKDLTPSVVAFEVGKSEPKIGEPAEDMMLTHPMDTIYSVKRFIGLPYSHDQVRYSKSQVTYRIESTANDRVILRAADQVIPPTQISAHVLAKLKRDAEKHMGRPVTEAVITVPAYFTDSQRHATQEAGRRAGLKVRRLVSEPTAAALAFDLDGSAQTVVVFDLGGGTLDVSVIQIKGGGYRVLATYGDTHLGGDDFDYAIVEWIKVCFSEKTGVVLPADARQDARLREAAEDAKILLSDEDEAAIHLSDLRAVDRQLYDLTLSLTRPTFQKLIQPLLDRCLAICETAVRMARQKVAFQQGEIGQILLVGGQTLSPAVRQALTERFGWPLNGSVKPGLVVGLGAAVLAGFLNEDDYLRKRIRLWDVIAQPLGVELRGGAMKQIIKANREIPTSTKSAPEEFTTNTDGQTHIRFVIYQGADSVAQNNTHLGEVLLPLTKIRDAGQVRVKCWFEIDYDGILHVKAKELDSDAEEVTEAIDYFYHLSQRQE